MTEIIKWMVLAFYVVGAIDYVLDNKFKLGPEFENGLMTAGRLMLCMSGFMVLAPLIVQTFGAAIAPFFRTFGADPSILAGILPVNDAGGSALAMELADISEAGLFNGLIVGAIMGTIVMLTIPTTIFCAHKNERPSVIYGILCGIITVPPGCLAGGFAAGFPAYVVLLNTFPVLVISVLMLILKDRVVGGIAIFLAGAFTLMAVVRRIFDALLDKAGERLGINKTSVSAPWPIPGPAL